MLHTFVINSNRFFFLLYYLILLYSFLSLLAFVSLQVDDAEEMSLLAYANDIAFTSLKKSMGVLHLISVWRYLDW